MIPLWTPVIFRETVPLSVLYETFNDLFFGAHDNRHCVEVLEHVEELFCYVVLTQRILQTVLANFFAQKNVLIKSLFLSLLLHFLAS